MREFRLEGEGSLDGGGEDIGRTGGLGPDGKEIFARPKVGPIQGFVTGLSVSSATRVY